MNRVLKELAVLVATLVVVPRWLLYQLSRPVFGRRRAFQSLSQSVSRVPGPAGDLVRTAAYRLTLAGCGQLGETIQVSAEILESNLGDLVEDEEDRQKWLSGMKAAKALVSDIDTAEEITMGQSLAARTFAAFGRP